MKIRPRDFDINWTRKFIMVAIIFIGGMVLAYFAGYFAHFVYSLF